MGNPVENALTVFAGTLENTPEREFNGWIRRSEAALAEDAADAARKAAAKASEAAKKAERAAEAAEAAAARAKAEEEALDDEHDEAAELLLGLSAFTAKPAPKRPKPKPVEVPPAKKAKAAAKPPDKTEARAAVVNPLAAYQQAYAAMMAQHQQQQVQQAQQQAQQTHPEAEIAAALKRENAAAGAPSFFGGVAAPAPIAAPAPSVTQNPQAAAYATLQQQQIFTEEMQRVALQQQLMAAYASNPMMAAMMQNPEMLQQYAATLMQQYRGYQVGAATAQTHQPEAGDAGNVTGVSLPAGDDAKPFHTSG